MSDTGAKYDAGKTRFDLLNGPCLEGLAQVLSFGAHKYADDSWQSVPNGFARYRAAQERHWHAAVHDGQDTDTESGLKHAWHYLCNAMFLAWFMVYRPEMVREYAAKHVGGLS